MSVLSPSLYAELRSTPGWDGAFREGKEIPPEKLLQAIWQHQRIHRNKLKTVTGEPLFILHPGFLNREAGPDFRDAVVKLGGKSPKTGDIEVDPRPAHWVHHKHQNNPAYQNVVLHVVWNADQNSRGPGLLPMLELEPVLDDSPASLAVLLNPELASELPPFVEGKCSAPLRDLEQGQLQALLTQAAWVRFQIRAEQFKTRAREAGWTQALWEGLFRGLGYKHNTWPMLRLAEMLDGWHRRKDLPVENTARLLGLSGLLPSEIPARSGNSSRYVRQLWDCWWRERDGMADWILPDRIWRMAGTRPSNHPHRRLALAAQWVTRGTLPDQLKLWSRTPCPDSRLVSGLLELLQVKVDSFWSHHYTLNSRFTTRPIPLLGPDRVTDLAANVILPWLWALARQGRRTAICKELERRHLAWPASADNAVLKLARQRLFGAGRALRSQRMATQQGLLQIVRDYCNLSNSLCENCRFPEVARRFVSKELESEQAHSPWHRPSGL